MAENLLYQGKNVCAFDCPVEGLNAPKGLGECAFY
jgi:hypothetical protein